MEAGWTRSWKGQMDVALPGQHTDIYEEIKGLLKTFLRFAHLGFC